MSNELYLRAAFQKLNDALDSGDLEKIEEANEMNQGRFIDDMVHANIMLGEHFKRKNSPESKEYFKEALKLAQEFKDKTGNAKFDYIIAKLKVQVR